jgi:maltooligosyltrehalose trehalohydrolase
MTRTQNIDSRSIGVTFNTDNGRAEVVVWAPLASHVAIKVNGEKSLPLQQGEFGYWRINTGQLHPGDRYVFVLNGKEFPDPASLAQPDGTHGPSQAIDFNGFRWADENWQNPALQHYVFYELHTGAFTPDGNLQGIEKKLDYLVDLGITAIEIMPVAQFPGKRNWGYDGVFPFAVQNSYGGAGALQQLVDKCHQKSLAVVLDVVYNHLGPEGNYLPEFAPYFTEKYKTPWGNAINFDDAWCDGVRQYFIENALMWFRDFHIDALRLDAVHAIRDFGPKHILQEIKEQVEALQAHTGKPYHLIVECDLNDNRFIDPISKRGYGIDAQWNDEFHHALRVTAGQERHGYYCDFTDINDLAKSYRDAYVYDGRYSEQRHRVFGVKTDNPGDQFVVFSQNHDQVGNRMMGERTSALVSFEMQKLMAAAVVVSPYLPLLFMGEEWAASSPFQYFVSHTDQELIKAVQKGRKEEFKAFHADGEPPDPQSEETFERSKLDWSEPEREPHKVMLNYYKALIALRKKQPVLQTTNRKKLSVDFDKESKTLMLLRWCDQQDMICLMNFSTNRQTFTVPANISGWQKLFDSAESIWGGPGPAPQLINSNDACELMPESAAIYTQYYV